MRGRKRENFRAFSPFTSTANRHQSRTQPKSGHRNRQSRHSRATHDALCQPPAAIGHSGRLLRDRPSALRKSFGHSRHSAIHTNRVILATGSRVAGESAGPLTRTARYPLPALAVCPSRAADSCHHPDLKPIIQRSRVSLAEWPLWAHALHGAGGQRSNAE